MGRTRFPVAGNHEWATPGAAGHLEYFGEAGAPDGVTWYAATVGAWRVIVLDSNCGNVGGCADGSTQLEWLRAELRGNPSACTVAVWHHPRFSSGVHGDNPRVQPFWDLLGAAGADLVVNGHDHDYERFAPMRSDGTPAPEGLRQIVVGTGGAPLRDFPREAPNSEARAQDTYGVLRLELSEGEYAWSFVPVAGQTFTDSGTGTCH